MRFGGRITHDAQHVIERQVFPNAFASNSLAAFSRAMRSSVPRFGVPFLRPAFGG
jgi:hypothetical protein